MMKLDETELKLKEDIDKIFSGEYDKHFSVEQVEYIKMMSFLYNHLGLEADSVTFTYNDVKFRITGILEIPDAFRKDHVIHALKGSSDFKLAYQSFCRNWKLGSLGV